MVGGAGARPVRLAFPNQSRWRVRGSEPEYALINGTKGKRKADGSAIGFFLY